MLDDVKKQLVYIGSDHAGFANKNELKKYLVETGRDVTDLGTFTEESVDYPDIAREVSEKVLETPESVGVLLCGTGIGMSMAANKLHGIRAALCNDESAAEMSRRHNDANVLAMGARTTETEMLKKILEKFLMTKFEGAQPEGERHLRRVEKMMKIEKDVAKGK
ncbi:MAG: ribose 5-phosphate isomerase B [Candidatus Gracilibacteria bacterium]|jgi:ribose 5-phosphate isomerase B